MKFFLGTHVVAWLARSDVPLFISRRKLEGRKSFPRAICDWALDSGGFTELSMHGEWRLSPSEYVSMVRMFSAEIGMMRWAAAQDWMNEPVMLKKTGLTVEKHQRRTVDNIVELRMLDPSLPFVPTLQGWEPDDYARCIEMYDRAGIDLAKEPVVGVGSVCRRQGTDDAVRVFDAIARAMPNLRLHGFGFKVLGLSQLQSRMVSSDSLAWSFRARRSDPMPGHESRHKSCSNCLEFALQWRTALVDRLESEALIYRQPHLL